MTEPRFHGRAADSKTQALGEKKSIQTVPPPKQSPLSLGELSFATNRVEGAGGSLYETCLKRHELKTGTTTGRFCLAPQPQPEGSQVLRHSQCPALQAVLKAASILGLLLEHVSCLFLTQDSIWIGCLNLCFHHSCQLSPFAPQVSASLIRPVLWALSGVKVFCPADTFPGQEKWQLVQKKYPGEGRSNFDRQVTDRRWYLPGKYLPGSQQKEFCRPLPAERNQPLPAACGERGDLAAKSM